MCDKPIPLDTFFRFRVFPFPRYPSRMPRKSVSQQLDEYRPDMPSVASFGLQEILAGKLVGGHTLDPVRSDMDVLYEERVRYLMDHPEDISFLELTKAAQTKDRVELSAGDEFCRFMASFRREPSTIVDGVEVVDPRKGKR